MTSICIWLFATLFCVFIQACFSMIEMAALSFNRIRLQYLVRQKVKRAIWLQRLLKKPYRLFGTVMLGVNCALQIGSQSAREFYHALHLDPDLAPISQIFLVVILGELAPLFAARRCSEHVIMLLSPIVYFTYQCLSPLIWIISLMTQGIYRITGCEHQGVDLSREHLQKLLEQPDEEDDAFNSMVSNVIGLRTQSIRNLIHRLPNLIVLPHTVTVGEALQKLQGSSQTFIPLYEKRITNIVGVVSLDKLAASSKSDLVLAYCKRPLFLTANRSLTTALETMAQTAQTHAIILGRKKGALGILLLESVFERLFYSKEKQIEAENVPAPLIERSVAGSMRIADFNREYGTHLPGDQAQTLSQLLVTHLEGPANQGDHISIGELDLEAQEMGLTGVKTVRVKSLTT